MQTALVQRNGTNIPGTTNSSLTITNTQTTNGGSYTVLVTDMVGSVRSTAATLTLIRAAAPSVTTLPATHISLHSAILNGTVNPTGSPTTAHFEYGLTDSYGNSTPLDTLGNGTSAIPTSQLLTGLDSGTTYHFRLVATNGIGIGFGDDQTFTTTASPALLTPVWRTGQFSVSISTEHGAIYHLESKTNLSDPEWVRVSSLPGNGQAQLLADPGANHAQSFYRVVIE